MLNGIARFALCIGVLMALLVGIGFVVEGGDFFLYRFFAPRQEAARRQIFEESKSYNDGMTQELQAMQFEYLRTDPEHRAALASVILHRVAGYDVGRLPPDLQTFIHGLLGQNGETK